MSSTWRVVVWERVDKFGKWIPYSGEVCQLLEQSFRKNLNCICLGDADVKLKSYTVNFKELMQISEETGTRCEVRRVLCDEKNVAANQVMWEWRADSRGAWNYYSTDVANVIEEAYKAEEENIDLSQHVPAYHYEINFQSMVQKNKKTKYHRPIRRINTASYPRIKVQDGAGETILCHAAENGHGLYPILEDPCTVVSEAKLSPKKKPFVKQVSSFWNWITKSSDSDSECGSDNSMNASITKKQCMSKEAQNNSNECASALDCHNNDVQKNTKTNVMSDHAIVDGKPWKQPWPPHTPQSQLRPVPGIEPLIGCHTKTKGRRKGRRKEHNDVTDEVDVLNEFVEELLVPPSTDNSEEQVCIICYEEFSKGSSYDEDSTLAKLTLCSHVFHKSCLKAMYDSGPKDNHIQCPTCKTIHGIKHGIQPPGTMDYHVLPYSLPGHSECDTIRIIYEIPPGTQGPGHPNPGKHYTSRGFPRHCYLPDNEMGRKVLRLLVKAWERRLIFTIGSSSTTGEQNTVTWNEIHHKTEFGSNRYGHGYPDPNYFENIISELAAQGVTETTYAWFPA